MTETQHRPGIRNPGGADDQLDGEVGTEGSGQVLRMWHKAVAKSKRESQERRRRVLAYPDLVYRLTDPPLRLSDPSRWSGWIPPRLLAEDACTQCEGGKTRPLCSGWPHRSRLNDSPVRRQLVDIAAEAMRRESDQ